MTEASRSSPATLHLAEEIRLIAGAKHGDHASFEQLVDRYMGKAMTVARAYVNNREDALELAQEAFYRVYRSLDSFREGEPFAPWFFRILRNTCLSFLSKHRKRRHLSLDAPVGGDPEGAPMAVADPSCVRPERGAELSEEHRQLRHALDSLPFMHKEILILRHFEELDYASIAEVLDIPIGTVMSRLFHARRKLKDALDAYMGGRR
ncbi:MAG: sigma-70 family RNA polymerase sigma factor [Planctomycetota bacterium]